MGSTSGSRISCFQCRESSSNSDHFKNGWRLRNGEFAKLCFRCACIYNDGRFCETFHLQEDGWRHCESCGKLVHCGCIASFNTHMLLDLGGVICMQCTRINLIQARHQSLPVEMLHVMSDRAPIEPQYLPHCTAAEIQAISRKYPSVYPSAELFFVFMQLPFIELIHQAALSLDCGRIRIDFYK